MKIYALVITVTPNDKQDSITAALDEANIDPDDFLQAVVIVQETKNTKAEVLILYQGPE